MKTPGFSEADAQRASKRTLLKPQWVENARIESAREHLSRRERETIELVLQVPSPDGGERTFKDWLSGAALGAHERNRPSRALLQVPRRAVTHQHA